MKYKVLTIAIALGGFVVAAEPKSIEDTLTKEDLNGKWCNTTDNSVYWLHEYQNEKDHPNPVDVKKNNFCISFLRISGDNSVGVGRYIWNFELDKDNMPAVEVVPNSSKDEVTSTYKGISPGVFAYTMISDGTYEMKLLPTTHIASGTFYLNKSLTLRGMGHKFPEDKDMYKGYVIGTSLNKTSSDSFTQLEWQNAYDKAHENILNRLS